jgi:hypothetical protein
MWRTRIVSLRVYTHLEIFRYGDYYSTLHCRKSEQHPERIRQSQCIPLSLTFPKDSESRNDEVYLYSIQSQWSCDDLIVITVDFLVWKLLEES